VVENKSKSSALGFFHPPSVSPIPFINRKEFLQQIAYNFPPSAHNRNREDLLNLPRAQGAQFHEE
jgi:hypothetical protein